MATSARTKDGGEFTAKEARPEASTTPQFPSKSKNRSHSAGQVLDDRRGSHQQVLKELQREIEKRRRNSEKTPTTPLTPGTGTESPLRPSLMPQSRSQLKRENSLIAELIRNQEKALKPLSELNGEENSTNSETPLPNSIATQPTTDVNKVKEENGKADNAEKRREKFGKASLNWYRSKPEDDASEVHDELGPEKIETTEKMGKNAEDVKQQIANLPEESKEDKVSEVVQDADSRNQMDADGARKYEQETEKNEEYANFVKEDQDDSQTTEIETETGLSEDIESENSSRNEEENKSECRPQITASKSVRKKEQKTTEYDSNTGRLKFGSWSRKILEKTRWELKASDNNGGKHGANKQNRKRNPKLGPERAKHQKLGPSESLTKASEGSEHKKLFGVNGKPVAMNGNCERGMGSTRVTAASNSTTTTPVQVFVEKLKHQSQEMNKALLKMTAEIDTLTKRLQKQEPLIESDRGMEAKLSSFTTTTKNSGEINRSSVVRSRRHEGSLKENSAKCYSPYQLRSKLLSPEEYQNAKVIKSSDFVNSQVRTVAENQLESRQQRSKSIDEKLVRLSNGKLEMARSVYISHRPSLPCIHLDKNFESTAALRTTSRNHAVKIAVNGTSGRTLSIQPSEKPIRKEADVKRIGSQKTGVGQKHAGSFDGARRAAGESTVSARASKPQQSSFDQNSLDHHLIEIGNSRMQQTQRRPSNVGFWSSMQSANSFNNEARKIPISQTPPWYEQTDGHSTSSSRKCSGPRDAKERDRTKKERMLLDTSENPLMSEGVRSMSLNGADNSLLESRRFRSQSQTDQRDNKHRRSSANGPGLFQSEVRAKRASSQNRLESILNSNSAKYRNFPRLSTQMRYESKKSRDEDSNQADEVCSNSESVESSVTSAPSSSQMSATQPETHSATRIGPRRSVDMAILQFQTELTKRN